MPNNGAVSSGSNQGPLNPALATAVESRVAALRAADPGNTRPVPVDLVTASGSGLDPQISIAAAEFQVPRVARERGLPEAQVLAAGAGRHRGTNARRARRAARERARVEPRARRSEADNRRMTDDRPDPDQLLAQVQAEEARARRGRLRVFFGASAGVGKTYAMLEAALAAKAAGTDVVVGYVEPHGRRETERMLETLESLPLQPVRYRGMVRQEFNLDAALQRHPEILLVDELAHSNLVDGEPPPRHAKRWQDIAELCDAGINVWTTLNVQHLESLNDLIAQITGVRQRETIPDHVLDEADEIELIDLPPDDLLQRLQQGKVYVSDQVGTAVERFFRKPNLMALRELALRRTADRVDAAARAQGLAGIAIARLPGPRPAAGRHRSRRAGGAARAHRQAGRRRARRGVDGCLRGDARAAAPLGRGARPARRHPAPG